MPAGTYFIEASAPGYDVEGNVIKLKNVTDATDTLIGTAAVSAGGGAPSFANTHSFLKGRFIIAGTKVFEIQQNFAATEGTNGLGRAAARGVVEVYAEVLIWKVL